LNAAGKPVADIVVETLQRPAVEHCHGVVDARLDAVRWREKDPLKLTWPR
jgi:hypothetical protein